MAPGNLGAVLADLARLTTRLERLERAGEAQEGSLWALEGSLGASDGLFEQFAALHAQFEELTELIGAGGVDDDGPAGARISPIWWPALSDEDYAAARRELRGWLRDVLAARYPSDAQKLTPCWEDHPVVVDLLTAAWVTWAAGLLARSADARDAAEWHLRWRPGLIAAAEEELNKCRRGHQEVQVDEDLLASFDPDRAPGE